MSKTYIKWVGNKTKLLKTLAPKIPDKWNNYFEPFAGSAAMYLNVVDKKPNIFSFKQIDNFLFEDYPFETVYGTKGRSEFLLRAPQFMDDTRIECKWQQVGGTVDEKYPYLLLNMEKCPENDIIIIYGGGGYREEAIGWMQTQAEKMSKNVRIYSTDDALVWINKITRRKMHVSRNRIYN